MGRNKGKRRREKVLPTHLCWQVLVGIVAWYRLPKPQNLPPLINFNFNFVLSLQMCFSVCRFFTRTVWSVICLAECVKSGSERLTWINYRRNSFILFYLFFYIELFLLFWKRLPGSFKNWFPPFPVSKYLHAINSTLFCVNSAVGSENLLTRHLVPRNCFSCCAFGTGFSQFKFLSRSFCFRIELWHQNQPII